MVDEFLTAYGSRLVIAVIGVGIGFLLLIGILYLVRRRSGPSPFLRGGKNRQPRLQVLDAAAVDARRRIVLIRRDNVEHLVMIGGPTDVVIESGIGAACDGETMGHVHDDALRMPPPPAEPRLETPLAKPQIAAKPESTPTLVSKDDEPQRPAAPSMAAQSPPLAPAVAVKPVQRTSPERPEAKEPIVARSQIPEPVILPEAPAIRHPSEPAKPAAISVNKSAPDIGAASDALDAARRRVFQPAADRTPPAAQKQDPTPSANSAEQTIIASAMASFTGTATSGSNAEPESPAQKTRSLGSDFDRILEEEMANKLSIEKLDGKREAFTPVLPRRDPANPKVTGATPEPTLQNEIARIFGEMSVTREDR